MLRIVSNKESLLTVRFAPDVLREYKIAATLRGGTMSGLVHMFVVQMIRQEKEKNPEAFKKRGDSERPVFTAKLSRSREKERTARKK